MQRSTETGIGSARAFSAWRSPRAWRHYNAQLRSALCQEKAPRDGGALSACVERSAFGHLALDFDLDAAVRRQAFDQRLALLRIRLGANHTPNRPRLSHAQRLHL